METTSKNTWRLGVGCILIVTFLSAKISDGQQSVTNYAAGELAPAFTAKTTDGKLINFPAAYKGKIVLLDFWATWCGPCRAELPNVVKAYDKYHANGLEILGISLDRANNEMQLKQFATENKMPWPQVYDGKYWKAELAVKYRIHSIPRPILVDGNTGIILAEGNEARGRNLDRTIQKALENRKKAP